MQKKTAVTTHARVQDILLLLGKGVLLSTLFLFPHAGVGIKAIYDFYKSTKREEDFKQWQKYNLTYLRFLLKRLQRQKLVTVYQQNGYDVVRLTKKGKVKVLKYQLEEMQVKKQTKWDHKWRLIIYDITKFKHRQQTAFRRMLKKLKFLPLQKSVYMTPYPCHREIEFLREYFEVEEGVIYVIAEKIENDVLYRQYFGF